MSSNNQFQNNQASYKLTTINLINRSTQNSWAFTASHRAFNMVLTMAIALALSSQTFAQKTVTKKKKQSINQQILAQAQTLQGPTVKLYSDENYKRNAKKTSAKTALKTTSKQSTQKSTAKNNLNKSNVLAQSGSSTFGPSNRIEFEDKLDPNNSNANISTTLSDAKKEALPENKLNGSVAITVGHDDNLDEVDREDIEGGFFEMKPSLSYEGKTFVGSFGAAIKDYTSQENSEIAKSTSLTADLGAKFSIANGVSTKSNFSFLNRDFRWPDFITGADLGMDIRFFETKFTQSADFELNALKIGLSGSYSNRDYSTTYSDGAPDVLGRQDFQRDFNEAQLKANFDVKFNENFSFIAKPMLQHRKYKDEPARQTTGQKGGAALAASTPEREFLVNELAIDLKTSLGAFTITPTAKIGQTVDRALGAEDNSYSGAGLTTEIMLDKNLGLKLGGSVNVTNTKYDNWIERVEPVGEKREVEAVETGLNASVNLSKAVAFGIDYYREYYKSNVPAYTDENFTREVVGSTITVSF